MKNRWLFLLLPLWMSLSSLKAENFNISLFEVHVTITPEGYADFRETITVQFSQSSHGILRAIPYRNIINNVSTDFIIEDVKVDGYNFSTSKDGNNNLV